jgi:DNA-binding XRE family transcriptional regulator
MMYYYLAMPTLKELRDRLFLSPGELAEKAGVPASTIYNLESGKNKPIRRTVRKLADALGVRPEDIEFTKPQKAPPAPVIQQPPPSNAAVSPKVEEVTDPTQLKIPGTNITRTKFRPEIR